MVCRNLHSKKKLFLALTAGILVLGLVISYFYLSDYYHAELSMDTVLSNNQNIYIKETADYIVFQSKNKIADTGFIFYPGGKVEHTAYAQLMSLIAEEGYIVILAKMPFHLAVFHPDAAENILVKYEDVKRWFIGGHSLGGAMAAQFVSGHDTDVEGIVFLGAYPAKDLSQTSLKSLSIYGSRDKIMNQEKYKESLPYLPKDWTEEIIEGGNHAQFGNYGNQKGDGTAQISPFNQQQQTAALMAAFMEQD